MAIMAGVAARQPAPSTCARSGPEPGPGQVLLRMAASTICGSDIGHLPRSTGRAGGVPRRRRRSRAVRAGRRGRARLPVRRRRPGGRLPHRRLRALRRSAARGYTSAAPRRHRARVRLAARRRRRRLPARRGATCLPLPDELSYLDGALHRLRLRDRVRGASAAGRLRAATLLVIGLGPVGLAAGMLGRGWGARRSIGTDVRRNGARRPASWAWSTRRLAGDDAAAHDGRTDRRAGLRGDVDCSGNARRGCSRCAAPGRWGGCALVGEGGRVPWTCREALIHRQITAARLLGDLAAADGRAAGEPGPLGPAPET